MSVRHGIVLGACLWFAGSASAGVRWEIGDVTAAPGQTGVKVPVSLFVDEGDFPVTSWSLGLKYDPEVVVHAEVEDIGPAGFLRVFVNDAVVEPGTVGIGLLYDFFDPNSPLFITAENSGVAFNLNVCLSESAPLGASPVEAMDGVLPANGAPPIALAVTQNGNTVIPAISGGMLTVDGDPIVGAPCDASEPPPEPPTYPPRPEVLEGSFRLDDATARRGEEFAVPFRIEGNGEVKGYSFSIDFDEEVLEVTSIEDLVVKPDGASADFQRLQFNNSNDSPGGVGVDEGYLVGAVVFSLDDLVAFVLPRDEEQEVLLFHLRAKPDAPLVTSDLVFSDGALHDPPGQPVPNVVTIIDASVDPDEVPSMVLVHASIEIVGDASAFIRGDSNGDNLLELADAQKTLNVLFLGGDELPCEDAADTNDDGELTIVDPIRLLNFLFIGATPPPSPHPEAGLDPTPDRLLCAQGQR